MASASVTGLVDCREVDASGSLGRFRANGPIAAHPSVRMHRVPPCVVLAEARISNQTPLRGVSSPGKLAGSQRASRLNYSPALAVIPLALGAPRAKARLPRG